MFFNPWQSPEISRRHLPHWHQDGVIYFVTFRLADSIPKHQLRAWRERRLLWDDAHTDTLTEDQIKERDELFNQQIDRWLDQGAGQCHLSGARHSIIVSNALRYFDGERYTLNAHVVMPNHVHVLIQPAEGHELSKILHSIKSFSAHEINKELNKKGEFWQDESYDRIVRSPAELSHFREYIRRNPAVAKVTLPEGALYL